MFLHAWELMSLSLFGVVTYDMMSVQDKIVEFSIDVYLL